MLAAIRFISLRISCGLDVLGAFGCTACTPATGSLPSLPGILNAGTTNQFFVTMAGAVTAPSVKTTAVAIGSLPSATTVGAGKTMIVVSDSNTFVPGACTAAGGSDYM